MQGQEKMEKKRQFHRDLSSDGKDLWKRKHRCKQRESKCQKKKKDGSCKTQNKTKYPVNKTILLLSLLFLILRKRTTIIINGRNASK